MNSLPQDLGYALRQLRKNPVFACTAIVILGLGIGASTAIFSAVNPILFEPLPYPHADRIMMIWYTGDDGSRVAQTFHTYRELAERSRSFDAVAAAKPWQPTLTGADQPERIDGQRVSASYFRALGVSPTLGRDFQASDDVLNGPKVVVLSNGFWRRHFGGDGTVVGRQVKLDDDSYTVIGVMPLAFDNVLDPSAGVWSPLQFDTGNITSRETREWGHQLRMAARLRTGVSLKQARRDLEWIARTPVPEFPRPSWASLDHGLIVNSLQDDVASGVKPALLAVLGAVILVLLIACVNVTNLLLARGAQRHGEFAMRAALGAARPRLIRQLLTESLLLAVLGGVFGMVVAGFGVRALVALSPTELPRVNAIRVDGTVFAFALGITTLIGLVVGLIPALHTARSDLHIGVQQSSGRTAGGHQLTRRALVVTEVAIALVLLVSAGLLLRSLQRLFAIDPGFDASHVLTLQVQESGHRFDTDRARDRFFTQALEAVRQVPGVTAAAFTSQLPLSGDFESFGVQFASDPNDDSEAGLRYAVSPSYFEAMRIPLRRGRLLDEHDLAGAPTAVLISESLAKRKFPNQDPIGQRVRIGPDIGHADRPWGAIVGVVGDPRTRRCGGARPRHQESHLVGGQGSAHRAGLYHGQPACQVGGRATFCACPIRGIWSGRAAARGHRNLWRPIWQRHRAHARDRSAGGVGRDTRRHSRDGDSPRHDSNQSWSSDRDQWSGGCEPGSHHPAVRRVAPRPDHIPGRDRPAGRRVGGRVRRARVARGASRSVDHVTSGIIW
jgi:putative ABC transport system permease protein